MDTRHGLVKSKNLKKQPDDSCTAPAECLICSQYIHGTKSRTSCLNSECELVAHLTCLADLFLEPGEYVPIQGRCPFCDTMMKWGDVIRKMKGCSRDGDKESVENNNSDGPDENESDDDVDVGSQSKGIVDEHSWMLDCNEDL